jgi:hypothetical protein
MTEGAGITASAAKSLTVLAHGVAQTTPGRSNVERPDLHLTNNDILAISGSLTANRLLPGRLLRRFRRWLLRIGHRHLRLPEIRIGFDPIL